MSRVLMTKRNFLIGITAPAIVKATSIMPISSIDDWDPYVLALKCNDITVESAFNRIKFSQYYDWPSDPFQRALFLNKQVDCQSFVAIRKSLIDLMLDQRMKDWNISHVT